MQKNFNGFLRTRRTRSPITKIVSEIKRVPLIPEAEWKVRFLDGIKEKGYTPLGSTTKFGKTVFVRAHRRGSINTFVSDVGSTTATNKERDESFEI